MGLFSELLLGTILLAVCAILHVASVAACVPVMRRISSATDRLFPRLKVFVLVSFALCVIVFAHSVQVWLWAASLLASGAINSLEAALYFSLVTYTTLGYGDITLSEEFRLFAAFASVAGLLTFGISTAFLVGLLTRILPRSFDEPKH